MRALAGLLATMLCVSAQTPLPTVTVPADWASRDLEVRWVTYRAAIDGAKENGLADAWAKELGRVADVELLEWIALFDGWQLAGPELVRLDAPQMVRVAIWNLGNFDSHGESSAKKALLEQPGRVLGWLNTHPNAVRGPVVALRDELVLAKTTPRPHPSDLPPHDPMQVLVPWLEAPATLEQFDPTAKSEPGRKLHARYAHQVVRALGGVLAYGNADDSVITKVVALTRHGNEVVRLRAFDTLSRLPDWLVPFAALAKVVDDAEAPPDRRRLALLALSASSHPDMLDVLVRIARDPDHVARDAASARLGEVGDPVAVVPLREAATSSPELQQALTAAFDRLDRRRTDKLFARSPALASMLRRAAWQHHCREARAPATRAATVQLVLSSGTPAELEHAFAVVEAIPPNQSPLRGAEAAAVTAGVELLVKELRAALAPQRR